MYTYDNELVEREVIEIYYVDTEIFYYYYQTTYP